jgi:hypothetical protein
LVILKISLKISAVGSIIIPEPNHSMDKITYTKIVRPTTVLLAPLLFHMSAFGFFKEVPEIDHSTSAGGYLAFHAPPRLSFADKPTTADRGFLLLLGKPINSPVVVADTEDNVTSENDFPLIAYDESDSNQSGIYQIPQNVNPPILSLDGDENILPPADPFVSSEDSTLQSVNNTDELMRLFENGIDRQSGRVAGGFQFLPPYTVERGNMLMQSKATYTRKMRN